MGSTSRHPENLIRIVQHLPKIGTESSFPFSYYQALHDHATSLAITFGDTGQYMHFVMQAPAPVEDITVRAVTPGFFKALGVQALYGRVLLADDATENVGVPPAVLSYGFWRSRFSDPRVVRGQIITVNGHDFVIVGVMPRDFNGIRVDTVPDIWIPLRAYATLANLTREFMDFELAGRLKRGVTRLQAQAECRTIWQSTMKDYYQRVERLSPDAISMLLRRGVQLEPLERGVSIVRDDFGNVLKLLMASMCLLLLVVCTSVAGLLLARGAARQQEFAVRLSVGATRGQLVRQVLAENCLLAAFGAAGGLLIAHAAMPLAVRVLPPIRNLSGSLVPLSIDISFNLQVFWFVLVASVLTMMLFSLSPVIAVSRSSLDNLLRGVRSSGALRGRRALIVLEIALCTFMLAIASLFVRTFQQLSRVNPGFNISHMATFTGDLSGYAGAHTGFLRALTEQVREVPGVASVAIASRGVMRGRGLGAAVAPTGEHITRGDFLDASVNYVSREYFDTMGMRILSGRDFLASDKSELKPMNPERVVVNQEFAKRFFKDTEPVGKRFGVGVTGVANGKYEIVGVVSDAKYRSLREPVVPTFYTLETQFGPFVLYVRTRVQPKAIIEPVRKVWESVGADVPILEVDTMAEEVDNSTAPERLTAAFASLFGAIVALLVGVGIYGLLGYVVTQRRREIGIRMALGAQPVDIAKLIARETLVMMIVGIALGLGGALLVGPAIRSLLYGVSPQDPKSLVAAMIFVALTGAVATALPAVRAMRIDPSETLRSEN